jgi:acyl-lipid omega-6 desaturase (Delta-12 desaturase)
MAGLVSHLALEEMTKSAFALTRDERIKLVKKRNGLAVTVFLAVVVCYLGLVYCALASSGVLSFVGAALCGLSIGVLFIVGHDACHHSYTSSSTLNNLIGRLAFLPSLHPFSLWDIGHNKTHHRFNNIRGKDYVWEPMSPSEYAESGLIRRLSYRFYHHPLGIAFYYLPEIWFKKLIFPWPSVVGSIKAIHLFDTLAVWSFLALELALCVFVGAKFGKLPIESISAVFLIPFLVWNALMSIVIYLHHMHPDARWYRTIEDWKGDQGAVRGTVHVRFPPLLHRILLNIMDHAAHHYLPGVPLYKLPALQSKMVDEVDIATWTWSITAFLNVCRCCKLFDYEQATWVDFAGRKPGYGLTSLGCGSVDRRKRG